MEPRQPQRQSRKEHTVHETELVGLILATNLANKRNKLQKSILFSDNQAAIKAILNDTAKNKSYLIPILVKAFERTTDYKSSSSGY